MNSKEDEIEGKLWSVPRCRCCGSERVALDAWACWNPEFGVWELETVFDDAHCHHCEEATTLIWLRRHHPPNQRIRELNDRFRREGLGRGSVMLTRGIQEKGSTFAMAALQAVRDFDAFTDDNDPWGEHDYGAVLVQGERVLFKIDYYDPALEYGSENPANEGCTHRVLTLILPSEY